MILKFSLLYFSLQQVRVSESYGLRFPREFALLMKQLLYFDRYTRLLAPNMNMLQDQRISIVSNRRSSNRNIYQWGGHSMDVIFCYNRHSAAFVNNTKRIIPTRITCIVLGTLFLHRNCDILEKVVTNDFIQHVNNLWIFFCRILWSQTMEVVCSIFSAVISQLILVGFHFSDLSLLKTQLNGTQYMNFATHFRPFICSSIVGLPAAKYWWLMYNPFGQAGERTQSNFLRNSLYFMLKCDLRH